MIDITIHDVLKLSTNKMMRHGVPEQEAEIAAHIFLEGELWGKRTHGFRYLENCLVQYHEGATRRQELSIERTTANSALVDGGFHFPSFVHYTAMQQAIEMAKARGVAVVGVRNSGFSGLLGYYSQMATQEGLIGIAVNSALAAVVAPGGVTPLLSTNPLTIGIPRLDHPPLILDMATSAGTYIARSWLRSVTTRSCPLALRWTRMANPRRTPSKLSMKAIMRVYCRLEATKALGWR